MTAKEAREKATSIELKINNDLYMKIMIMIEKHVGEGKLQFSYGGDMNDVVKKKLQQEGYTVRYESHLNESHYWIGW